MKNRILIPILAILIFLSLNSQGLSLVEETHRAINEYIAQNSVNNFSLNNYLIKNLGLAGGVKEIISGVNADGINLSQTVFEWLGYGGFQEDRPGSIIDYLPLIGQPTRSVNHFHNPLGGLWKYSGLDAWVGPLHYTGESSVLWAQNQNQDPGGKWSWQDSRRYYYIALTGRDTDGNVVAPKKQDRDLYFAKTFRAIGQLMHLIHDASVPAHVRNQIHILFNYEKWIEKIRTGNQDEQALFDQFIARAISFDPSILNFTVLDSSAPIPIANIIDTDKYNGSNPDVTTDTAIGIAEYTNANFFSERTIFKNFQYPNKNTSVDVEDQDISDPRGIKPSLKRPYYIKKRDGENTASNERLAQGKQGYRLATAGLLYRYAPDKDTPALDEGVYNDYAEKLLPRAVGYSAGLLEYFFRGKLYVALLAPSVDQAIYNFGNENDMGRDIGTVAMFIQNSSKLNNAIEPIGQGTISLTVSYIDSRTGETVYQPAGTGSVTDIPDTGSQNFLVALFTLAQPIPTQFAKELTYYLVFRGRLGKEEDAVIGKVIKAPVIQGVSPDQGIEGTLVTITGDYLPEIDGPFPSTSRNISFSRDPSRPYTAEVISRTDTVITTKVPNTAAILKPGYGGLRVRSILPETEEMIYSNPVPFFPIAEGEIRNFGGGLINANIEAVKPILGTYSQLPGPVTYPVLAGNSVWIQLMTGFTYKATANTSVTQDIWTITPDAFDFIFDLQ